MKKVIVLVGFLFMYVVGIAQPITQRGTTAVTVQDARLFAQYNFRPPVFPDTLTANENIGIDSCGALIFSRDINAYYYRACSPKRWVRFSSGGGSTDTTSLSNRINNKWDINGNSNIVAGTNFLGTTNSVPVEFRFNNTKSGIIDSANKNVGLGYSILRRNSPNGSTIGTYNTALGHNALSKDTLGAQNVAVGGAALGTLTTRSTGSVAIGYAALNQSKTPSYDVAIGWGALARDYYGIGNVAIGADVSNFLAPSVGDTMKFNTLVGYASAYQKKNGNYNVFLGDSTGALNVNGSGNVFIGSKVGKNETGSNKLYIGNSSVTVPLIKGDFADSTLIVNGMLAVGSTNKPDSTLDVKGSVRMLGLLPSNNIGDSMMVVKLDGGVGYRSVLDTTNKFVNDVTKKNDSTITVFKGSSATDITLPRGGGTALGDTVYTISPIMSITRNDSNIVYFNPDTANVWRGGSVSISQGYGIINSPNPITSTGTIIADTSVSGLSGKYLRLTDTATMLNPYPRGSGAATTVAFWNGSRSLTNNSNIFIDNTNPATPGLFVSNGTSQRAVMFNSYSGIQYNSTNYAYNTLSGSTPFLNVHNELNNIEGRYFASKTQFNNLTTSAFVNVNAPRTYSNREIYFPDSSGTIALKEYTIDSLRRNIGTDSVFARKNGQWNFQYKDSIGGGRSTVYVDSIYRTAGKDSIYYKKNGNTYAIKDSVGTNPPASGYYLSISDSTTQDNPTANTPRAVKFNVTDLANGFSLNTQTAIFVGTINNGGVGAGTTLNVTSLTSGKIKVGMVLTGGSITAGTFISAFISGSGGIGTYEVSVSQLRTSATYTGTMTSQIVCANTGIYNLQFSSQMDKTDAGVDYVNFWLRKNGTDITASSGVISLQGNSPAYMMAAWNYVIQLVAGDTIELYWGSADINMSIKAETSQTSPFAHPAVQSTIFTITQQAGILAGTGITAINSLTGSVQTMVTGTDSTDFKIVSTGTSHTFNLPTASASKRGALSSTDWTTFNNKIGASDTSVFQRKNIAAYSFMANNTNAAANATPQTFRDTAGTYTGTITWTGTTAPTTPTINYYQWQQTGKMVRLQLFVYYTNAGSALTAVTMTLPSDCPAPDISMFTSGATAILYNGTGGLGTSASALTLTTTAYMRRNAGNTANELYVASSSANYRRIQFDITYRAQ